MTTKRTPSKGAPSGASEAARAAVWVALVAIWREAAERGATARFGQRRLAGRAAEFGATDDYEVAVYAVEVAIENWRKSIGAKSVVLNRIAAVMGCSIPHRHYPAFPDDRLQALEAAAATDTVAWAACASIVEDAIDRGIAVPAALRSWAVNAMRGAPKPDSRTGDWLAARNDAIRAAVRFALESGAFRGAEHSEKTQRPGSELPGARALSACDLVAKRMSQAGMGLGVGYHEVAKIWRARDRSIDVSESIKM